MALTTEIKNRILRDAEKLHVEAMADRFNQEVKKNKNDQDKIEKMRGDVNTLVSENVPVNFEGDVMQEGTKVKKLNDYQRSYLVSKFLKGGDMYQDPNIQFRQTAGLYQEGTDVQQEVLYEGFDQKYDYKIADGIWSTREKGSVGEWKSLENNKAATDKLNAKYPSAIELSKGKGTEPKVTESKVNVLPEDFNWETDSSNFPWNNPNIDPNKFSAESGDERRFTWDDNSGEWENDSSKWGEPYVPPVSVKEEEAVVEEVAEEVVEEVDHQEQAFALEAGMSDKDIRKGYRKSRRGAKDILAKQLMAESGLTAREAKKEAKRLLKEYPTYKSVDAQDLANQLYNEVWKGADQEGAYFEPETYGLSPETTEPWETYKEQGGLMNFRQWLAADSPSTDVVDEVVTEENIIVDEEGDDGNIGANDANAILNKKEQEKKKELGVEDEEFTLGDKIGILGGGIGAGASLFTTIANRMGDKPSVVQMEDVSARAEKEMRKTIKALNASKAGTKASLMRTFAGNDANFRNAAQSWGQLRARKLANTAARAKAIRESNLGYDAAVAEQRGKIADTMFKGDVYEAQDRTRAATENKADRDAFWSNLGAGLQNLSGTAQKMGAAYNQRLLNAQGMQSMNAMFGQFELDKNKKVQFKKQLEKFKMTVDENGNIVPIIE